jgi:hypothetical protein
MDQTGLVLIMDHAHKGKIQMDHVLIMDRDHKDLTDLAHKGQIQTGLVQIMVRALRGIDHKGQIQTGLVQIMMLDQKMETTHKKKDLENSRSFFLSNCHLL